jgi:hypothetical protein
MIFGSEELDFGSAVIGVDFSPLEARPLSPPVTGGKADIAEGPRCAKTRDQRAYTINLVVSMSKRRRVKAFANGKLGAPGMLRIKAASASEM